MKKTWINAELEELNIQATAGGECISMDFDGPWQQNDKGQWVIPGGNLSNQTS